MEWVKINCSLLVRANLQGYKKDLSIEIEKVLESFKLDFNHENGFVSSDDSLVIQEYLIYMILIQMFSMGGF